MVTDSFCFKKCQTTNVLEISVSASFEDRKNLIMGLTLRLTFCIESEDGRRNCKTCIHHKLLQSKCIHFYRFLFSNVARCTRNAPLATRTGNFSVVVASMAPFGTIRGFRPPRAPTRKKKTGSPRIDRVHQIWSTTR